MARILIIDDDAGIRRSLKSALERRGHEVVTAEDCDTARRFYPAGFDLILLDMVLPDGDGLGLLTEILARNREQAVVMISAHGDIDTAVRAIKQGAWDFIEKPLSLDRVLVTVENATRSGRLRHERTRLTERLYGELVGRSEAIQTLREQILRSAPRTERFLLTGENGTGKELAAHMIHRHSRYADGPFVAVNCAALPAELVEAELFGHTAGAFTGARKSRPGRFREAEGGTIFLDEISEMPVAAQAKLLRVLETHEVTPVGADRPVTFTGNVIAATNRDLAELIADGRFREDLYYRLNVVQMVIPPLRKRPEDIPVLAEHFLGRLAHETGEPPKRLTEDAVAFLQTLPFRGNVRELRNLVERVTIYCETREVTAHDLRTLMPELTRTGPEQRTLPLREAVERFERDYIQAALAAHDRNVAETARRLGLERSHLYKKLKKYGLS